MHTSRRLLALCAVAFLSHAYAGQVSSTGDENSAASVSTSTPLAASTANETSTTGLTEIMLACGMRGAVSTEQLDACVKQAQATMRSTTVPPLKSLKTAQTLKELSAVCGETGWLSKKIDDTQAKIETVKDQIYACKYKVKCTWVESHGYKSQLTDLNADAARSCVVTNASDATPENTAQASLPCLQAMERTCVDHLFALKDVIQENTISNQATPVAADTQKDKSARSPASVDATTSAVSAGISATQTNGDAGTAKSAK